MCVVSHERRREAGGAAQDQKTGRTARDGFRGHWWSIGLLAATLGLAAIASIPGGASRHGPGPMTKVELPRTTVERIITRAADEAPLQALRRVGPAVDEVFRPVHGAVEEYVDFHYSILGEYVQLTALASRSMGDSIESRLFAGFGSRLEGALTEIDAAFGEAYRRAVADGIAASIPDAMEGFPLGEATEIALRDALDRAQVAQPIAMASAIGAGAAFAKLGRAVGRRLLIMIVAKSPARAAAKSAGALGGTGAGAAIGALLGPAGAAIGGAAGGIAAWLVADAAIVTLDEFFNRDEFEAELRALVDEERMRLQEAIEADIARKAAEVAGLTIQEAQRGSGADR